jgi:hypothetical protein
MYCLNNENHHSRPEIQAAIMPSRLGTENHFSLSSIGYFYYKLGDILLQRYR